MTTTLKHRWFVRVEWKPQDCWIGVFWKHGDGDDEDGPPLTFDVWVCLLPMVPIHFGWRWRSAEVFTCSACPATFTLNDDERYGRCKNGQMGLHGITRADEGRYQDAMRQLRNLDYGILD